MVSHTKSANKDRYWRCSSKKYMHADLSESMPKSMHHLTTRMQQYLHDQGWSYEYSLTHPFTLLLDVIGQYDTYESSVSIISTGYLLTMNYPLSKKHYTKFLSTKESLLPVSSATCYFHLITNPTPVLQIKYIYDINSVYYHKLSFLQNPYEWDALKNFATILGQTTQKLENVQQKISFLCNNPTTTFMHPKALSIIQ